jgi:hypothetical protein
MPNRLLLAAPLALALSAAAGPAAAQLVNANWTSLSFDECTVVTTDDFGSTWACPGLKGLPVMVHESERRFRISYGLTSTAEKAADQTLPPVNTPVGEIEWRVSNAEGSYKPFATIVAFELESEGETTGTVLVVTRVAPGATCHVAYVDTVNPDAEKLARQAADEKARDFDCAGEPEIIGELEAWTR